MQFLLIISTKIWFCFSYWSGTSDLLRHKCYFKIKTASINISASNTHNSVSSSLYLKKKKTKNHLKLQQGLGEVKQLPKLNILIMTASSISPSSKQTVHNSEDKTRSPININELCLLLQVSHKNSASLRTQGRHNRFV